MQLSGDLSKISLPNLLRLAKNGALTGKIALSQGAKAASIFLENGNVVHVETDEDTGKDALMELFLWLTGSFSFIEENVQGIGPTFNPAVSVDSTESLLKDGLVYLEQKKYLEQLHITGKSVLKPKENAMSGLEEPSLPEANSWLAVFEKLDGQRCLNDVLNDMNLSKPDSIGAIATLLKEGLAVVANAPFQREGEFTLPDWVVARLKQDNPDVSQAIIDMVIWVDRVKCWMYQADADFSKLIAELNQSANSEESNDETLKRNEDSFCPGNF